MSDLNNEALSQESFLVTRRGQLWRTATHRAVRWEKESQTATSRQTHGRGGQLVVSWQQTFMLDWASRPSWARWKILYLLFFRF